MILGKTFFLSLILNNKWSETMNRVQTAKAEQVMKAIDIAHENTDELIEWEVEQAILDENPEKIAELLSMKSTSSD
jgi:hypothetical protein